ncbi:MAG: DUF3971 domain-containing protein [Pseudomonadota bacterium]
MNDSRQADDSETQRIRFDRTAQRTLQSMPSHAGVSRGPVRRGRERRMPRALRVGFAALSSLLLLAAGLVGLTASGVFDEQLAARADAILVNAVPEPYSARSDGAVVGFSWPASIGVRYQGFQIADDSSQTVLASAETVAINLDVVASLSGTPVFSSIEASGVTIDGQALTNMRPGEKAAGLQLSSLTDGFNPATDAIRSLLQRTDEAGRTVRLVVDDATLAFVPNGYADTVEINALQAVFDGASVSISGEAEIAGQSVILDGRAVSASDGSLTASFAAQDLAFPVRRLGTFLSNNPADHEPDANPDPVSVDVRLAVSDNEGAQNDGLTLTVTPKNFELKLADGDFVPVFGRARLSYEFDDQTITWSPDRWRLGQSVATVSARIRQAEQQAGSQSAPFEFEMLFNRGEITPSDSPERTLTFASRVQGLIDLDAGQISYTNMELDTSEGYARAEGVITLAEQPPIAIFDVSTTDMTIAGLKQLWPGPVAREARRWTLNSLAGGRVLESRFQIAEPLRRRVEGTDEILRGDSRIEMEVEGVRFDLAGDLPPVRDGNGRIRYADEVTQIDLSSGKVFLRSGRSAEIQDGTMTINVPGEGEFAIANVDATVSGSAAAIGEIIQLRPIEAQRFYTFEPDDLSGDVTGLLSVEFALNGLNTPDAPQPDWSVELDVSNAGSAVPIEGRQLSDLSGSMNVNPFRAIIDVSGDMDGLPADIGLTIPFAGSDIKPERRVVLDLDDGARERLAPGLEVMLTGRTPVVVGGATDTVRIDANLENANLSLPWIGWAKGRGIPADVAFNLLENGSRTVLDDFSLAGDGFGANGRIEVAGGGLAAATMNRVWLNPGDQFSVNVRRDGERFDVAVDGESVDLRALMRHVRQQLQASGGASDRTPVDIEAQLGTVAGFNGEIMRNVAATARIRNGGVERFSVTGTGASGMPFSVAMEGQGANRRMRVEAFDAGEFLRFVDVYGQIQGGALGLDLTATPNADLVGPLEIRDFRIFNEPALDRLVSTSSDGRGSLRDAVNRDLDLREVPFDLGVADLQFGAGTLDVSQAYIRGPLVGFALQGRVFDRNNQIRVTGTFLPAYGLNSIFAEIPLLGLILGNGRDRGLIGVTFLVAGDFDEPRVTVNPLSVIAPGIFRNIFQFR